MAEINQNVTGGNEALRLVLEEMLTDLTNIRNAITGITAKLDADGGVTDTNYAATQNPAALKTTS